MPPSPVLPPAGSLLRSMLCLFLYYEFPDEWCGDQYYLLSHDVWEHYGNVDYLTSTIEAKTDAEKDIYYYNFPGYSGNFVIDSYNQLGQLSGKRFNNGFEISYGYNMRGKMTSINSPVFTQNICYENSSAPCYNGNISEYSVAYGS